MNIELFKMADFKNLQELLKSYKHAIRETPLTEIQVERLMAAIKNNKIKFYVAKDQGKLVAMCSICITFSTYSCMNSGIFEDFYIHPDYRKKGLAKKLTQYVFEQCKENNVNTIWVGSSDMDLEMYKYLGFDIPLGQLLTWTNK